MGHKDETRDCQHQDCFSQVSTIDSLCGESVSPWQQPPTYADCVQSALIQTSTDAGSGDGSVPMPPAASTPASRSRLNATAKAWTPGASSPSSVTATAKAWTPGASSPSSMNATAKVWTPGASSPSSMTSPKSARKKGM